MYTADLAARRSCGAPRIGLDWPGKGPEHLTSRELNPVAHLERSGSSLVRIQGLCFTHPSLSALQSHTITLFPSQYI